MQVSGAKSLRVASDGRLELDTVAGPVTFLPGPLPYQDTGPGADGQGGLFPMLTLCGRVRLCLWGSMTPVVEL